MKRKIIDGDDAIKSEPHRRKRRVVLQDNEVAALRQFVERVEALTRFVRDILGER